MDELLKILYQESLNLEKSIQMIDIINDKMNSRSGDYTIKHLISIPVNNVKIKMYQENHNEPHVHIDIGRNNHIASISIKNQKILAGQIKRKYEKKVLEWVEKNKDNLLIIWNKMQSGEVLNLSSLN